MATQSECAEWLDLSERRFRELLDQGAIERAEKGQYDLKSVVQQYVRNIREVAAGRGGGEAQTVKADEEARLLRAKADKAEMEAQEMRGDLVPAAQIADTVNSAVIIMKTRLGAVPAKAAPLVAGVKSIPAVERVIRDNIEEALDELSKTEIVSAAA